jgi:hypothetical protein
MKTIAEPAMQAISVSRFSRVVGSGPVVVFMRADSFGRRTGAGQRY